jgi:hypothetical protein
MKTVDLVKCSGTDCTIKETCVRYLHPARDKYQSYLCESIIFAQKDEAKCKWWAGDYESILKG